MKPLIERSDWSETLKYGIIYSYTACTLPPETVAQHQHGTLIPRLHCHWKPSQSGTVLKIAPCWPLTGSVYTVMIKAVWVLSIFDLKGGASSSASRNIDSSWRLIYGLFFCRQKKCTGRHKNTRNAATQSWYCCHVFWRLKHTGHSTARLSTMLARFGHVYTATVIRAEPCWFRAGTVLSGSVNAALEVDV